MFESYLLVNPPSLKELQVASETLTKICIETVGDRKFLFLPSGDVLDNGGFMGTCWQVSGPIRGSENDSHEAVVALGHADWLVSPMLQFLD